MSDFGLDAYSLGDLDPTEASHPLEIARDLIATGKPRSALDVLAEHHKRLADDPDYLMLCAEAWRAAGDGPRAQHALLGAIRIAPRDPRPLRLLGDLLVERGEQVRAQRVFDKAERLGLAEGAEAEGLEEVGRETSDDLIAAAERDARTGPPVNPRQLLFIAAVVVGIGVLTSGIALLVAPTQPTAEESSPAPEVAEPVADIEVVPPSEEPAPASAPLAAAPVIETPKSKRTPPVARRATKASKPSPPPRKKAESLPEPPQADVDAELAASTDAAELTARADALGARGQPTTASALYRRALEIDPDYAPALVGIGRSLLRAEKYAEAMANATRALQFARGVDARPGLEAEALYQMGRVQHQRGHEDSARRLFRQATSLPRAPAAAWFYLGESLSRDNSPAARDAYDQYLARNPNGHLSERARRAIQ